MNAVRGFLVLATIAIYAMTVTVVIGHGVNWPAVAVGDLLDLNWRSQFDLDFILYLLLVSTWIVWREGATARAYVFGVLNFMMGGMFAFPYLLHASVAARGRVRTVLLGVHD
ncbi:hypothetical protein [Sinimarinibacterium flocculans]|uniref:DUF2834 domain-containing protein n=1 Tax=Sinimarinibacterium flocculans TaxID=985250 RepID=A0A318EJ18_9GAMM|nr:hypothetical protein [Sinimarinibacterium flocculans]MEC9362639.1 hypothetical protein [Pseudomonadota bacterium]PXV70618.1 hypothetical protein C8D93_102477 [Sinimarinibacterium flocculans]